MTEIRLKEGVRYDLTATKGVLVQGKRLNLEGYVGDKPELTPVIRLAVVPVVPSSPNALRLGTLTVARSESVRIRGVRFELTDPPLGDESLDRPVGVFVVDVAKLDLMECRFDVAPQIETADPVAMAVAKTGPDAGVVAVAHCYFGLRRGTGLQFAGRWKVDVFESAFAPHPAAIALRPDPEGSDAGPSELVLRHTTFMLDKGAVVEADDGARWVVSAGFCVFAAVPTLADGSAMMMTEPETKPVVFRDTGDKPDTARFAGIALQPNAYFNAHAYATGEKRYSFDQAAALGKPAPATDDKPIELRQSPWAFADPLSLLKNDEPWKAFRLSLTLKPLQLATADKLPGVHQLPSREIRRVYLDWPPLQAATVDAHIQVWYPQPPAAERDNLPPNHHTELLAAVAKLRPGDALEIKHTGELPVPAEAVFNKPKANVIVRPAPGFKPVLVPAASNKFEQSLFLLNEGELTLDGLEIRLSAKPGDVRSAVTVVAGKRCTLKDCLITLDEQGDEKLAAVLLADPSSVMRVGGAGPTIRIENCFFRGKGRGIWVQSSRPFDMEVRNSAAVLAGSFLQIDAGAKPPAAGAQIRIRLDRVTAAFAAPVFDLHPGRTRQGNWVPVAIDTDGCLFSPLEKGIPFANIDGADPTALEKVLAWVPGSRPNWYANFPVGATFVEIAPADATATPTDLVAAAWFAISTEKADESLGTVTFAKDPLARKLTGVRPADVDVTAIELPKAAAKPSPGDAGADVAKLPSGDGS